MKSLLVAIAILLPCFAHAQVDILHQKPTGRPAVSVNETLPTPAPILEPVPDPVPNQVVPLEVSQVPIVYLSAGAAEVIPAGDRVLIFAEDLQPGKRFGMIIRVVNQPVEFIEVHPKANPFPPRVLEPMRPGTFLIEGNLGDVFYVSIRAYGEAPTWETVTIVGDGVDPDPVDPDPTDPPPATDGEIEKLSRARADALNDPPTRVALKASLESAIAKLEQACAAGDCADLPSTVQTAVAAIEAAMAQRTGASRDVEWKLAWRVPVSDAIKSKSPTTAAQYLSLIKEAAKGL